MTRHKYIKGLMGKGLPRNIAASFTEYLRFLCIPYKRCYVDFVQRRSDGLFHMKCAIPMRYASNVFFYDRTIKENDMWLPNEDEVVFQINREEFNNQSWENSQMCRLCEDIVAPHVQCFLQMCCKDDE